VNADKETHARWERLKIRWPPGHEVEGVVLRHVPFGIFLDVGEGPRIVGLVLLPDMPPEVSRPGEGMPHLPPLGSRVLCRVLGFRENNLQVALTMLGPPAPRPPIGPGDRVWGGGWRYGVARSVLPDLIVAAMNDTKRVEVFTHHDLVRRDD
jgi:hypothetical protein